MQHLPRFALVLLTCATPTLGQPTWKGAPHPEPTGFMAFDPARDRLVLVQDPEALYLPGATAESVTWEWNRRGWARRKPGSGLPARSDHAVAYDPARERVVVFGGTTTTNTNELWEWNGLEWVLRAPPTSPPGRNGPAMAFDERRGRMVMFGGRIALGTAWADTWEWDGSNWRSFDPPSRPAPRSRHAMTWDPVSQRVLLFGGLDSRTAKLSDLWAWDGNDWTLLHEGTPALARHSAGVAWDRARNRLVVQGGILANGGNSSDTWEWDGTGWSQRTVTSPVAAAKVAMAWDHAERRTVAMSFEGDLFAWDGVTWTAVEIAALPILPKVAEDPSRQRIVLFGGSETWQWNGDRWRRAAPPTKPPGRYYHAMATDVGSGGVLMFGGVTSSFTSTNLFGDTWAFDGADWTLRNPANAPSAREAHAMAYDPDRDRVLLFGGCDASGSSLDDTWEWDGTDWTLLNPAQRPFPRDSSALAYDPGRRRFVLFGGVRRTPFSTTTIGDTWEWDGTDWVELFPSQSPSQRSGHAMAYHDAAGQVVLFGGSVAGETWTFDGSSWTQLAPSLTPFAWPPNTLAADTARGVLVLPASTAPVTYVYGTPPIAAIERYGTSCAGMRIDWFDVPRLGSPVFGFDAFGPSNAAVAFALGGAQGETPLGGCTLWLDPTAMLGVVPSISNASGFAHLSLPLPPSPTLAGARLFVQAAAATPTGLAASEGVRLTTGY